MGIQIYFEKSKKKKKKKNLKKKKRNEPPIVLSNVLIREISKHVTLLRLTSYLLKIERYDETWHIKDTTGTMGSWILHKVFVSWTSIIQSSNTVGRVLSRCVTFLAYPTCSKALESLILHRFFNCFARTRLFKSLIHSIRINARFTHAGWLILHKLANQDEYLFHPRKLFVKYRIECDKVWCLM